MAKDTDGNFSIGGCNCNWRQVMFDDYKFVTDSNVWETGFTLIAELGGANFGTVNEGF